MLPSLIASGECLPPFRPYEQWQTTNKTGPGIALSQAAEHYRVDALGFVTNVVLPSRKVSLGAKYF